MKYTKILAVLFSALTFGGATYVLMNHGRVSAGYAVIPMVFAVACIVNSRKN